MVRRTRRRTGPPARRQIYVADDGRGFDVGTRWRRNVVRRNLSAADVCFYTNTIIIIVIIFTHTPAARRTNTIIINIIKIYYS